MRVHKEPLLFMSYRRADTTAAVRSIAGTLRQAFGPSSVFVDTETIRTGDHWPVRIDSALKAASVLLVAIGPAWLRIADDFGRRRLDQEGDWVRNEIQHALDNDVRVVPLLISGAQLPKREALPICLASLLNYQAYELRDEYWEQDLAMLLSRLEELGCRRTGSEVQYPKPHSWPKELTPEELEEALERLPVWRLTTSMIPGQEPKTRTELMRTYQFAFFEDAVQFMGQAVPYISNMNHHPRWENVYATVTVWLTSWDIGFRPSRLDVELAVYLDSLYRNFVQTPAARDC